MSMPTGSSFLLVAVVLVGAITGCAGLESRVAADFAKTQPEIVAVLPFQAAPDDTDAPPRLAMVRQIFQANFGNLGYHQAAIDDVDQRLRRANLMTPAAVKAAGPKRLGEILEADAIVFGENFTVSSFSAFLIYRRKLSGTLSLVSTRTGNMLWEASYSESATGGVALDSGQLFQAVSDSIDTGRDVNFVKLAQAFCRTVVSSLPRSTHEETAHEVPPDLQSVTVRLGGTSPLRAGDRIEVEATGARAARGTFELKPLHVGLPLSETAPGVYRGVYVVEPGEAATGVVVSVRLVNRFGATSRKEAADAVPFVVDATPPPPPGDFQVARNGAGVELAWEPPKGKPVESYRVFRARSADDPFMLVASTPQTRWVDTSVAGTPLYQIVAVDGNGNVSFPAGPATLPGRGMQ
ncbi:MAG: DUF799 family lipoprotein [Planctomycetes bacterium]|nr:DUF799 family lipoprotein [Planctomycetota bacterium]MBI3846040.1 DUF799 family lipoprotein [Planctomycetota bacterium]